MADVRVTIADCRRAADSLNARLERIGSTTRVEVSRRYNYCAVDEMRIDGRGVWYPIGDPIAVGTKRECWRTLQLLARGFDMGRRP